MALHYAGHYSDGRSAARRSVKVRFTNDALLVADDDEEPVATWAFAELRLVGEVFRNQPVRLTSATEPDARLSLDDPAVLTPLFACAPHLRSRGPLGARPWLRAALWGLGVATFVAALVFGLPRLAEPVAALIPLEWETALGERFVAGFLEGESVCTGAAGSQALQRLTDRLGATVETPYGFTVRVVDVAAVNAFAAPGGQIVVFRGLLESAESPDEVAGVLAHEMGHVVERHATEAVVRALGLSLLFELLVGDASAIVGLGAEAVEALLGLSYSRRDEAEADAVAVAMLAAADIRADGLAAFLGRLDQQGRDGPAGFAFLSTHPPSRVRAEAMIAAAGGGRRAMSQAEWRALESICERPAAARPRH